jgi:hypothetical protein
MSLLLELPRLSGGTTRPLDNWAIQGMPRRPEDVQPDAEGVVQPEGTPCPEECSPWCVDHQGELRAIG